MSDAPPRGAGQRPFPKRGSPERAACPGPDALLALAERRGGERERLTTLDHTLTCAGCRAELEAFRAIALAAAAGDRAAGPRTMRSVVRMLVAVAVLLAAGSTAFLLRPGRRGPATSGGGLVALSPSGAVAAGPAGSPVTLAWSPEPGALRYEAEVRGPDGATAWTTVATDTVAAIPATVALPPGQEHVWTVRAVRADGSRLASAPVRFTVTER